MSRSRSRSRSRNRSRSRTRSRSRSRDRYRNRNRGGRDRDRDRDRDRRGKDRDRKDRRDRDNSPRRRRNSSRSQSPSNRHYDHKSRNHDYNRRQNNESNRVLKPGEPNNYIILQGLHANVSDQSVHATLDALQASYENIKVIRDKQTGLARGFAFVKFISIEHARQFIDTYFPYIDVEGTKVKIDYSTSTSHEDEDWNCSQCGFLNFKRRDQCYKCGVPKNASATQFAASLPLPGEINDGEKDIGETPINILLLRYLDPISTEDTVRNNNNNNNRLLYYIISIIIVFS